MPDFHVRSATESDSRALGELGAALMRTHHDFDPERFIAPGPNPAAGYGRFLASRISADDAAVFVAERDGEIVGYVWASLEPHSWKELREASGFIEDVVVREAERRTGVATALLDAAMRWLRSRGAPRVILWTAEKNGAAQQLFTSLGFRRTMIEMTHEL
jgi:GNAT superfamily N-acetyltransferase